MAIRNLIWIVVLSLLSGCQVISAPPPPTSSPTSPPPTVTPLPGPTQTPTLVPDPPTLPIDIPELPITPTLPMSDQTFFGFTHIRADGNRLLQGVGAMTVKTPMEIRLAGAPRWVVAAPVEGNGSIWVVALEDGTIQSFLIAAGEITPILISPISLPPGSPPLLMIKEGIPALVTPPPGDASPLTHPIFLPGDKNQLIYIAANGDVVFLQDGSTERFSVGALPDARLLSNQNGDVLVLSGATNRYAHGVLGDQLEASTITLFNTDPPGVQRVIELPPNQVVEGHAPIWVDLDGDGSREILVTLADEIQGAQLAVYNESGELTALGPAIGRGFRWRHMLAAAPFQGVGLGMQVVDNLTPHLGGVTEFYELNESGLEVFTSVQGYSTHQLGSRNLDMALAGDLDGDGNIELMIPTQARDALGVFRLVNNSASIAWTVIFEGVLATNLSGVELSDGSLAVGFGTSMNRLLVWVP